MLFVLFYVKHLYMSIISLVGKYTFKKTGIFQLNASIIWDRINFKMIFLDTPINNVIISSLLSLYNIFVKRSFSCCPSNYVLAKFSSFIFYKMFFSLTNSLYIRLFKEYDH